MVLSVLIQGSRGWTGGVRDPLPRMVPDAGSTQGFRLGEELPSLGCLSFFFLKVTDGSRHTCPGQGWDQRMGWNEGQP